MAEDPTGEHSRRWLRWANEDLLAARHSSADAEIAPRVACGLAQQAAEKAVKALLVAADIDPPKSHNLLRLARMLAADQASELFEVDLEELTRWAIEGRYPDDLDEATTSDADRAVALASQVTALAHRAIGEEASDGGQ
jgi:HEPN domain-containing protein